jgi:hypothetical protein
VLAATGCTSIHSYNAAKDLNPKAISVSGSLGTGLAIRDRNGDGQVDGLMREKVLVPDAKANVRFKLNDFLELGVDPLPPSIGTSLNWRYYTSDRRDMSLSFEPTVNYLVWPFQRVWSVEVPVTLAKRHTDNAVSYVGFKGIYQSNVLEQDRRFPAIVYMGNIPSRPDQDFRFVGGFAGVAIGGLHAQLSPEIDYYYAIDGSKEQLILLGVGVRFSL